MIRSDEQPLKGSQDRNLGLMGGLLGCKTNPTLVKRKTRYFHIRQWVIPSLTIWFWKIETHCSSMLCMVGLVVILTLRSFDVVSYNGNTIKALEDKLHFRPPPSIPSPIFFEPLLCSRD